MKRFVFPLILFVLALAACTAAPQETTTQNTATWTPTETATATPLPTSTATPTSTPTATPTPLVLPVTNGTPVPDLSYEVITAENITRLQQVARYGYPRLLGENSFYTVIPYRLTADGKTLVVGTTLGLELYDAQTQEKTGGFDVEFLESFDMTPDGLYFLTSAGGTLTVWTRDGQKVREFDLPVGSAWALNPVAISPDGTLLAVQRVNTDWQEADKVDVYRVADGSLVDTVRGNGVVFSADFLATWFDGSIRLYPVAELGQGWETRLPKQTLPWCTGDNEICGLEFSPDGALAAVVRTTRVDVYQVADRRLVRQVSGWETPNWYTLPMVQVGQQALLITTPTLYDKQGNVRVKRQAIVVDIASGEWVGKSEVENGFAYLEGEQVRLFPWAETNTERLLGIKNNGQVVLESEKCQVVDSSLTCYWLSKDGQDWRLVSEQGETVLQFKSLGENRLGVWVFPSYIVVNHVFGVGAFETGNVHVYDAAGSVIVKTKGVVDFANATPSGKVAVLTYDGTLVVVEQGQKPKFFQVSKAFMMGLNDDVFVTLNYGADGDKFTFWDTTKDKLAKVGEWSAEFYFPADGNNWASVSPDGRLFLFSTGTAQNGIGAIPLQSDPTLTYLLWEAGVVKGAHFSPDGRLLATYGGDSFIRVWAVLPETP
ncbi:MAG: WD40 repeat domain-containing protein [Chloroflexota bacterium]